MALQALPSFHMILPMRVEEDAWGGVSGCLHRCYRIRPLQIKVTLDCFLLMDKQGNLKKGSED